jgi:hypothetical protein
MSHLDGQYVVATFDGSGHAHLVSVATTIDVLKVRVPIQYQPLLMAAKSEPTQIRFLFTFESTDVAAEPPIVTSATRVELHGQEQPITTHVGCVGCPEEPFDFGTGKWASSLRQLYVRNATSTVRSLVSQKCFDVLRQDFSLPPDHPLLQFDVTDLDFRENDADLFQLVEPQRWLDRATLPDVWRRSSWSLSQGRLPSCPPDTHKSSNIQQLQNAFVSSCSAAFHAFESGVTNYRQEDKQLDRKSESHMEQFHASQASGATISHIQRQFFLGGGGTNRREKHALLDRSGESHMDHVARMLLEDCRGDGHPFTASFQEARLQRNPDSKVPERELPFILERRANSFAVWKLYIVRMRGDFGQLHLSADTFVETTAFNCRAIDASHWTPRFQELANEAERVGPRDFRRNHRAGIVFGDHSLPCHATQVCVGNSWSPDERGGKWFQALWQRTEGATAASVAETMVPRTQPEDPEHCCDIEALVQTVNGLAMKDHD